jgi:hypothetical protein
MITLAFFFFLQPGKYTGTPLGATPFMLQDVQLWIGQQCYLATIILITDLSCITFISLTFTTQKNGVCGEEVTGLGCSGNPVFLLCPTYHAPTTTPLASYYYLVHVTSTPLSLIRPTDINAALHCSTAMIIGPSVGFLPSDISTCSLHAAGTMALLCAHVDSAVIHLLGYWWSNEMPGYLHFQAARTHHA